MRLASSANTGLDDEIRMASNPTPEEIAELVGDPYVLWEGLKDQVQDARTETFGSVAGRWLELMWSLDQFRSHEVLPPEATDTDVGALNRRKGNWFADLLALLLRNRTDQPIGARYRVHGFSQTHQIDVAWPAREVDPRICAECKVTGGPAYGSRPARGAMSDWTNRRKELKFAATDLKLFRRSHRTVIDHWDEWRQTAPPRVFFLWAARLRPGDSLQKMIDECRLLTDTYLDGAGIFAWQETRGADGYAPVAMPAEARVTDLDDLLHRIASEIRKLVDAKGRPPAPVRPS